MLDETHRLRVLVVEDNAVAAQMMTAILNGEGFDVAAVAADGESALTALARGPFDIGIVDLELPGTDLEAMLTQLRARSPRMRLVACSAHRSDSRPVNAARRYVDSVIPKEDLARSGQLLRNLCRDLPRVGT